MGGSKSPPLNTLAKEIWNWCIERDIWVSAVHIAGKPNTSADNISRNFSDKHEWSLSKAYFLEIFSTFPELNIDLFASRLNNQLESYCSWKPDPGCTYVDAFSTTWSKLNFFCFPTFQSDPEVCTKDYTRQSKGNITDPCVANTDLVSTCPPTTVQPTLDFQAITKPATSCSLQGATSTTQNPASDGLSFIRNTFAQQDLSSDITDILMASWRTGTKKQYKTYVERWLVICRERKINHSSPKIGEALQFLMSLYNQGLTYSTINTARSALSLILNIEGPHPFGSHPLVSRFLKVI